MITIDGSSGEGGGQVLRSSLTLSLLTQEAFQILDIRAGRPRPGLGRQHLTAVRAAAAVGAARVEGAELGSRRLRFEPGKVRPGRYRFSDHSPAASGAHGAGSTTLVLQTVLLPLLGAGGSSHLEMEGGTHNPFAPPFDFLERAFVPLLRRMGARVWLELERPGFYPAGGGLLRARVDPSPDLRPLELNRPGRERARRVRAIVSDLPRHIAEREVHTAGGLLGIDPSRREVVETADPAGPGNAVMVEVECEEVTEVFTGFGKRGVPAEAVAEAAAREAREWLEAGIAAGRHLQDQLLLPLAAAGGGSFTTLEPTAHTRTNIQVLESFLGLGFALEREDERSWRVRVALR